jgi:hypothetical protein
MQGIAKSQGFAARADKRGVLIVRGSLSAPEVYRVDTVKIMQGKLKDFRLLPGDLVFVPENGYKIVWELVDLAVNSFVTRGGSEMGEKTANRVVGTPKDEDARRVYFMGEKI